MTLWQISVGQSGRRASIAGVTAPVMAWLCPQQADQMPFGVGEGPHLDPSSDTDAPVNDASAR